MVLLQRFMQNLIDFEVDKMSEIEEKSVKELLVDFLEVLEKEFGTDGVKKIDKKEYLEKSKKIIYGLPVGLTSVSFNDPTSALGFLITILNGLLFNFSPSCCFVSTKVSDSEFTKMMVFHATDIVTLSNVITVDEIVDAGRKGKLTCLDVKKIQEVCKYFFETDFNFINYSFTSIEALCDFIKKLVKENKKDLFFIHHLGEKENLELIDSLAKKLNVAIVASCVK